jgi:DNA helicase II / ATP-dependent DNA helicase PcrA
LLIKVVQGGQVVREIDRPVRTVSGERVVTYKRRQYPVVRGEIHLDNAPPAPIVTELPIESTASTTPVGSETTGSVAKPAGFGGSDEKVTAIGRGVRDGDVGAYTLDVAVPTGAGTEEEPLGRVELTDAQRAVAYAPHSARVLVEAGPGTGKTETVAHRLVNLIEQGLQPAEILVLSFSRNAVKTLCGRIERMHVDPSCHVEDLRYLSVRTFDSWTFRMLRQLNFQPGDLLRRTYDQNIHELIQQLNSDNRNKVKDLLQRVRHIVVDEFQDLSGVRGALVIEILEMLAPRGRSGAGFTVLGDPAQAIYGFALEKGREEYSALTSGALVQQLRKNYDEDVAVSSLGDNFRAKGNLASVMANLRKLLLRRASGKTKFRSMVAITERIPEIEGELTPGVLLRSEIGSAAVLTSTNGEAIRIAQKLLEANDGVSGVPVHLHTRSQATAVPAWLGATLGPMQSDSLPRSQFRKIYRHLYEGDGERRVRALGVPTEEVAWQLLARATNVTHDSTSLDLGVLRSRLEWTDLLPDDEGIRKSGIHVMTIHQSKGMEFDAVAVVTDSLASKELQSEPEHVEAANVIFVGMTRAAKRLFRIGEGHTYGPLKPWSFGNDRTRWYSWRRGWMNIEAGIRGDVDAVGFVDRRVFNEDGVSASDETVGACQHFLAHNAAALRGRKVMLCKWKAQGAVNRYTYRIHLQQEDRAGPVLGVMTDQLTLDLLSLLWNRGYGLPSRIFNLRIADVVTLGAERELPDSVAMPWAKSRLWLGVTICGTADFKTFKRR